MQKASPVSLGWLWMLWTSACDTGPEEADKIIREMKKKLNFTLKQCEEAPKHVY